MQRSSTLRTGLPMLPRRLIAAARAVLFAAALLCGVSTEALGAPVTTQPSGSGSAWTWTWPPNAGTNGYVLTTDGTGVTSWVGTDSAVTIPLSSLIAATTTSSIDSANWALTWKWGTLSTQTALSLTTSSMTTGTLLSLSNTSTPANAGTVLSVSNSEGGPSYGISSTMLSATNTGYAGYFSNTGTGAVNYGVYGTAASSSGYGGYFTNTSTGWALNATGTSYFNGSVGIGTTAPAYTLDVTGTVRINSSGSSTTGLQFPASSASTMQIWANGNDLNIAPYFNANFSPANNTGSFKPGGDNTSPLGLVGNRWASLSVGTGTSSFAGSVGIGTAVPSNPVHVYGSGTGGTTLELQNTSTGGQAWGIISTGPTSSGGAGNLAFYNITGSTTPMVIQSGGNVGIGTTNPTTGTLQAGADAFTAATITAVGSTVGIVGEGATGGWGLVGYNTVTTANEVDISGSTYGLIVKAGNVGIGTTSPAAPLTVAPPASETIAAGATITANGCSTLKPVTSTAARSTSTVDAFTNSTAAGCCMHVFNVGTFTITLKHSANFKTSGGADVSLTAGSLVPVCSSGTIWYQTAAVLTPS